MKNNETLNLGAETNKEFIEEAVQINTFMPHHNKGMQSDIFTRYAIENAADAGRYEA